MGALLIGAISIVSLKNQPNDPGVTTELAFIMTYFIGALCIWNISLAAGLAVIMTTILIAKQSMHGIASQWITESELRDGIFLLALLLIALPLVPNKPFWGWSSFKSTCDFKITDFNLICTSPCPYSKATFVV